VVFDVVECLVQRDLGYTTRDVRVAYNTLKEALMEPGVETVVVIAHSQGGIVLSMALDNLLSDLPRERIPRDSRGSDETRFQEIGDLYFWMCGESFQ
jgi:esterase/lipase superfamily enzyme